MLLQYFLHRRVVTIYQTSNNVFFTTHSNTFPSLMRKICIPESELKITFSSSSGPGGQNVNKLATKVDVRFNIDCVDWITEAEKETLKEKLKSIVTKDGWILVKSDKTRSQSLNQKDAIEKMNNLVNEALKPPEPKFSEEELLRMKRGKAKANKERLKDKKFRGDTKRDRRGPPL